MLANLHSAVATGGARIEIESLPRVLADPSRLVQLFQNLIANAIKFCREETPVVRISARPAGDRWIFAIEDNGIGIDPQYHERIFSIFQRLHDRESYAGTGIGLTICRRIVEQHDGKIWVESTPGQGSTFCFTLAAGDRRSEQELLTESVLQALSGEE